MIACTYCVLRDICSWNVIKLAVALHYWMRGTHHCSGAPSPASEMTYTVSSWTLNSIIPYHTIKLLANMASAFTMPSLQLSGPASCKLMMPPADWIWGYQEQHPSQVATSTRVDNFLDVLYFFDTHKMNEAFYGLGHPIHVLTTKNSSYLGKGCRASRQPLTTVLAACRCT